MATLDIFMVLAAVCIFGILLLNQWVEANVKLVGVGASGEDSEFFDRLVSLIPMLFICILLFLIVAAYAGR